MNTIEDFHELNSEDKRNWEQYVVPIMMRATKGQKPNEGEMLWIEPYESMLRLMFPDAWKVIDG